MPHHNRHIAVKKKKAEQKTLIDKLMFITAFCYPLTSLPQIIQIYNTKSVVSLSLLSWVLYAVFDTIFLLYAISKNVKPLIVEGALWLMVYVLVIIGILIYR